MASPSERPRALVTGARGFTGSYVVDALERAGFDAYGLEDSSGRPIDLLDRKALTAALALRAPDVAIHLAAISFVAHRDVEQIYRVNIAGTRNLLEALVGLVHVPRHVILASSANVYGNAGGVLDEHVPAQPVNDYAVSKLAMELMSGQFSDALPMTIVRPFNYTGVGQAEHFLIPKIIGHFKRRERKLELGNLHVSRDFNDVRNVAAIYARLAALDGSGEVYNVCSGVEHTLLDVLEMAREISGHSLEVIINPAFVRTNEVERLIGDPTRINAAVGKFPQFKLRETLQWMYDHSEPPIRPFQ